MIIVGWWKSTKDYELNWVCVFFCSYYPINFPFLSDTKGKKKVRNIYNQDKIIHLRINTMNIFDYCGGHETIKKNSNLSFKCYFNVSFSISLFTPLTLKNFFNFFIVLLNFRLLLYFFLIFPQCWVWGE